MAKKEIDLMELSQLKATAQAIENAENEKMRHYHLGRLLKIINQLKQ